MTNALTIFNQLRPHTIGYDNIFDHFNDMFESSGLQKNYPPYDIIKIDDTKYDIQLALAGYSKEDITIEVKENTLSIKSVKQQEDGKVEVIHRGISKRYFERHFTIADDVKVKGGVFEMVQLWINLPKKYKMTDPKYQEISSAVIPTVSLGDKIKLRVVAGNFEETMGPSSTFTKVNLYDIISKENKSKLFIPLLIG